LEAFPKDQPAYMRLNVEVDDYLPKSAQEEAKAILKDTPIKFTYINSRRKKDAASNQKSVTVAEFQAMDPLSVAEMYARDKGIEFTDELKQMFRDAESQVKSEDSK
jgi:hypothetical protein